MPTLFDKTPQAPKEQAPEAAIQPVTPPNHAEQSITKIMQSPHQPMNLFSAYCLRPQGINFTNQEPDEIIILFLRRHFITNIPWILATLLLFILPPIIIAIFSFFPTLTFPAGLTISLLAFYYLISTSYAFGKFISWFYNIGVVTQKRIIDLDSTNILTHNTATANFNEIVDVKFNQQGFFQSTFDYGDVHIQTEAIRANFEFDKSPKPTIVADIISDLRVARGHHGNS